MTEHITQPANEYHRNEDYLFNDDLMLHDDDRKAAQRLYPAIFYALDFPELRAEFERVDPLANAAKARSRKWGCWAVLLVTVALLLAAGEPLYTEYIQAARVIAVASGILGLAGAVIGTFGLLHAKQKQNWLQHRLLTERIRLFHFSTMLALSDILLAGRREEYLERRGRLFEQFRTDVVERARLTLDRVIKERDDDLSSVLPTLPDEIDEAAQHDWRSAYRRLRIGRQIDYAEYKLQDDDMRLFSKFPIQQARWFRRLTAGCVAGLVIAHLVIVTDVIVAGGMIAGASMHVVGVWFAIVALALRTLQEGLQPEQEIERYRHYSASMRSVGERFDAARTVGDALAAASSAERLSANEMLIFLRSGHEARFVM